MSNRKRSFLMEEDSSIVNVDDSLVQLHIGHSSTGLIYAEINLLLEGLVDKLTFRHPSQRDTISMSVISGNASAQVSFAAEDISFSVNEHHLGAWAGMMLKLYRDGTFPVDHMDIEAINTSDDSKVVDLMLKIL